MRGWVTSSYVRSSYSGIGFGTAGCVITRHSSAMYAKRDMTTILRQRLYHVTHRRRARTSVCAPGRRPGLCAARRRGLAEHRVLMLAKGHSTLVEEPGAWTVWSSAS